MSMSDNSSKTPGAAPFDLSKYYDNDKYKEIMNQTAADPRFEWGEGLKVLLISDRALGRAEGLYKYLLEKSDFESVQLCRDLEQIHNFLQSVTPDIIIFVGMADKKINYTTISMAKKANEYVMVAMFASLDYDIEFECRLYGIPYAFSSDKPVKDGLCYLRQSFDENKKNIQMEIDKRARKEAEEVREAVSRKSLLEKIKKIFLMA